MNLNLLNMKESVERDTTLRDSYAAEIFSFYYYVTWFYKIKLFLHHIFATNKYKQGQK